MSFTKKIVLGMLAVSILGVVGCGGQRTEVRTPRPLAPQPVPQPQVANQTKQGVCANEDFARDHSVACAIAQKQEAEKALREADKKLEMLETPEERKALAQVAKEKKDQERSEEAIRQATAQAHIQGCPPNTVKVYPAAARQQIWRNIGPAYEAVTVTNIRNNNEPVSINDTDRGLLVENLCIGGSVTIYRMFDIGNEGSYGYSLWTATGLISHTIQHSSQISVYFDKFGGSNIPQAWDIRLQK